MPLLLADALPELATELQHLLVRMGKGTMAEQIPKLQILSRCHCNDDFCASFYTKPKPAGSYGPGHECLDLDSDEGMIVLDIVDGKIACVEVLYRDEFRDKLRNLLP